MELSVNDRILIRGPLGDYVASFRGKLPDGTAMIYSTKHGQFPVKMSDIIQKEADEGPI